MIMPVACDLNRAAFDAALVRLTDAAPLTLSDVRDAHSLANHAI